MPTTYDKLTGIPTYHSPGVEIIEGETPVDESAHLMPPPATDENANVIKILAGIVASLDRIEAKLGTPLTLSGDGDTSVG